MNDHPLFERMFGTSRRSNGNDPPLLAEDELRLAQMVFWIATQEVEDDDDDDDVDSVLSFDEKVETTCDNLQRVSDLFFRTNRASKRFLKNFPEWSHWRREIILKLRAIADSISDDRFKGNIAKIVGGCTGVVGGAVVVASLLCPPLMAATIPMAIGGGVAAATGGGVVFGTALTELGLLKKKMEEAKSVIAEDKKRFSTMEHWFEHTRELMEAIEEVVGFELMHKLSDDVKAFVEEAKKMKDCKGGEYNEKFRNLVSGSVKAMCASGNIQMQFGAKLAPVVITFVFMVCLMCQRNRFVLDCLVITHRLGMGLMSMMDVGVGAGRVVAGLAMRGGMAAAEVLPQAVARAVALGVFTGVGVIIDVANVVVASIDIHKGSLSEEAEKVTRVANELEQEFVFMLKVFDEIMLMRG